MNILITGITGFLGRNLTNYIINKKMECTIVGTAHSESKLAHFKKQFPDIKVYILDLASDELASDIDTIIKNHNINYIVHSAAMKHVDICQKNPTLAMKVNCIATNIIIDIAKKYNVKNIIALSTDKTNDPCNVYGMVKSIMQQNVLANDFSVYQGANFFWSDGSVLDIWLNQYSKKKPITIRNSSHIRYFNTIDHVCEKIIENLDEKKKVILPDYVYVIKLKDLLDAFCEYFNYQEVEIIPEYDFEKTTEFLNEDIKNKKILNKDEIIELINKCYNSTL